MKRLILIQLILLSVLSLFGQTTDLQNYERAVSYTWQEVKNRAFNLSVITHWLPDSSGFWYIHNDSEGKTYRKFIYDGYVVSSLFDHSALADSLSRISGNAVTPGHLPNINTAITRNHQVEFDAFGKHYSLNPITSQLKEIPIVPENIAVSVNGKWKAYSKDYNLWLEDSTGGIQYQLSRDGEKHYQYASYYGWFDLMTGENGDRPDRFSVQWSPDGRYLIANICDTRKAQKMYMLNWSVDSLYRPELLSYYRGSPGDSNMVRIKPVFFDLKEMEQLPLDLSSETHINPWAFYPQESGEIYFLYTHRGYRQIDIGLVDPEKNNLEILFSEISPVGIDNFKFYLNKETDKIYFLSERSGWRQLHEFNPKNGKIRNITNGSFYIDQVHFWDIENNKVCFSASGREKNENPYHSKLYFTDLKSGKTELLTPEAGHHEIQIDPGHKYFTDNISSCSNPTYTVLRDLETGAMMKDISRADVNLIVKEGWQPPIEFSTMGRDGKTPVYAAIWRPTNFDPAKKYPVIDHSYTGPHTQIFPRNFQSVLRTSNQALAELGFIVVKIDGMGTAGRSRAFRAVSYKNMGQNLEDHVLVIKQMAREYPWIDADKAGIYGHSAGGYDACHALLEYPDFYKVGVSSSADHDFRMEKAWWPEMYMGWPVDSTYNLVSNITMAGNLRGKLMLVHGALDNNVNISATSKMAEALIKNDKDFELVIFPSQQHTYAEETHSQYFQKKKWNFFVEYLLEKDPIWDFDFRGNVVSSDHSLLQGIISEYENPPQNLKSGPWSNLTPEYINAETAWVEKLATRLELIDEDKLSDADRINHDLLRLLISDRLFNLEFGSHQFPLNSEGGFLAGVLYTARAANTTNDEGFNAYVQTLKAIPEYFDQQISSMKSGQSAGKSSPKVIVEKSLESLDLLLKTPEPESFFLDHTFSSKQHSEVLRIVGRDVYPAYSKLRYYLHDEYLPAAPEAPGISSITDGFDFYQQRIHYFTTDNIDPEEVFNKGMQEVARIRAEMESIISSLNFEGSFADFLSFLRQDEQFYAKTPEELLKQAAWIITKMEKQLPKYFGKLPRLPLTVTPVPDALAPNYTGGRYSPGSYQNNRAGEYWVNTYNLPGRPLYVLPALSLHEGVPGHHTQVMLAAEIEEMPEFRKSTYLSAYGEGWALYAEYLGKEAGIYADAYEEFGRLTYEMWRACRLVVDPGIHYKGWTRQQAFDFMASNTALSLHEVGTEIDRYIGWPGQAVSYKMGELKIRALRAEAEKKLGDKFDIREFHDLVLANGSVPLDTLEWIVKKYIADKLKY